MVRTSSRLPSSSNRLIALMCSVFLTLAGASRAETEECRETADAYTTEIVDYAQEIAAHRFAISTVIDLDIPTATEDALGSVFVLVLKTVQRAIELQGKGSASAMSARAAGAFEAYLKDPTPETAVYAFITRFMVPQIGTAEDVAKGFRVGADLRAWQANVVSILQASELRIIEEKQRIQRLQQALPCTIVPDDAPGFVSAPGSEDEFNFITHEGGALIVMGNPAGNVISSALRQTSGGSLVASNESYATPGGTKGGDPIFGPQHLHAEIGVNSLGDNESVAFLVVEKIGTNRTEILSIDKIANGTDLAVNAYELARTAARTRRFGQPMAPLQTRSDTKSSILIFHRNPSGLIGVRRMEGEAVQAFIRETVEVGGANGRRDLLPSRKAASDYFQKVAEINRSLAYDALERELALVRLQETGLGGTGNPPIGTGVDAPVMGIPIREPSREDIGCGLNCNILIFGD